MNRARRKGTAWECDVRDTFRSYGLAAERLPSEGAKDRGDVWLTGVDFAIECKAEKSIDLAGGLSEAKREAVSAGKGHFAAVFKRRNHPARNGYAVLPLWQLAELLSMAARGQAS